jgi:hypothetical protein
MFVGVAKKQHQIAANIAAEAAAKDLITGSFLRPGSSPSKGEEATMTNKLLVAAIALAFGPTLRFGWFDHCKRNRINSVAVSSRSRTSFVS